MGTVSTAESQLRISTETVAIVFRYLGPSCINDISLFCLPQSESHKSGAGCYRQQRISGNVAILSKRRTGRVIRKQMDENSKSGYISHFQI